MMLDSLTIYWGLAINGFCTGLGVIFANAAYELLLKKRLKKWHQKIARGHMAK